MKIISPGRTGMDFNPSLRIYTCEHCRYTFRYPSCAQETRAFLLEPQACPDCGADGLRPASDYEVADYWKMQKILQEEIRMGLYAAG